MTDVLVDIADEAITEVVVVTMEQMQAIESLMFEAGMPVAALMEKVAGRITDWLVQHYPRDRAPHVGVIVGPGNNGGDALVVARELYHRGYQVKLWCPFSKIKALPAQHQAYAESLGLDCNSSSEHLHHCDLIVDGGFGLGLTRPLAGAFADGINAINDSQVPVVSIDLPSGLETNTGNVLGTAIRADHTLCLGLWKLGLLQDNAQPWTGHIHRIPFDVPPSFVKTVLRDQPLLRRLSATIALSHLPLPRSPIAHKYKVGHTLMIAGSHQYTGAVLLAGKGAIASGVGMLTIVVPESLKMAIASQLPEALIMAAPETVQGVIAGLPESLELAKYDVIACGPGLTQQAEALMAQVIASDRPLVLDADALNWLSHHDPQTTLRQRSAPTLLTPHPGEFRRLFADLWTTNATPSAAAQAAARAANCLLVLKGAKTAIAHPNGHLWINDESTAALARGGSGDVLTGLVAGLAAQYKQPSDPGHPEPLLAAALSAVWWHAQTGRALASQRSVLGCSASQLAEALLPTLANALSSPHPH